MVTGDLNLLHIIKCQSPLLSDQVLLDIPHVEGVMFNIKFTYLRTIEVIQDL